MNKIIQKIVTPIMICMFILMTSALSVYASDEIRLSKGQTIYVPAYSHIYVGNREQPFLLTVTLSLRNTDPMQGLEITTVDYYDTKGKLLKKYLTKSTSLGPLESTRYVIPQDDTSGGSGANFIVTWRSNNLINPLIAEAVMIGAGQQQGVSFTSRGQVISMTDK